MSKRIFSIVLAWLTVMAVQAQIVSPITWTAEAKMNSADEGDVILSAKVEDGWHLYGLKLPDGGPRPTEFDFSGSHGVEFLGEPVSSRPAHEQVDMVFHLKLSWWAGDVAFRQSFRITDPDDYAIVCTVAYQGCNDSSCMAPSKQTFDIVSKGNVQVADDAASETPDIKGAASVSANQSRLWQKVEFPQSMQESNPVADGSLWYIFIWGFIGGLLALLTPCVWPMIPLTVSFFLKKGNSRAKSIGDALTYGASIIVIYLVLGLAVTLIFGAGKLNELSTNAVFNLLFFAMLVTFGVSFLGAFEITLPSRWSNSVDGKVERTTGLVSIFFMAFTLALVSFSCTGPIIGTLLVQAASMGDIIGPAVGMGAFALALALPFTLFALFPSWLKEMPKSGGWLNSVKVVLGFLELALSLKFLSVADLAYGWGILDREVFVSLWVVLFVLLGLYLLGKIRFSHDSKTEYVSMPRFFMALGSLAFAVYLIPGLWGAPLKGVSAFVPPLYTQDFNLYAGGEFMEFHDYDEGMAYAAKSNRPVLIDFSGHGCVNCRKMEGAVFDTQQVSDAIRENFVLIKLMVDEKRQLANPYTVVENGRKVKIETVGDKWSYLQRSKFGANSQPYYVILDADGEPLAGPYAYDENVAKFTQWLDFGVENYLKK